MRADSSLVGRRYPGAAVYEVARERIRAFADAICDPDPAYRDPEAARALGHPDVIAPPTFPVVITMAAAARLVEDPELTLDWTRVVHGEQRFEVRRPLRAGDRIVADVSIAGVRSVAGNDMISVRTDLRTPDGDLVSVSHAVLVAQGGAG
jgi:acyl dehydratase